MSSEPIVVLGAGVVLVGLSTVLKIQEKGYSVTIVGEHFPCNSKTIRYTSPWAGAHYVGITGKVCQQEIDRETFRVMWKMSEPGEDSENCFLRIPQTEYYSADSGPNSPEMIVDFGVPDNSEILPGSIIGVAFTTCTIDTPVYLSYLLALFSERGGRTQRASIDHLAQLAEGAYADGERPAAGIGARVLGGVEDKDVYPIRGRTVMLREPWVRFARTQGRKDGPSTYIVPRQSGDVIVGGSRMIMIDILTRGLALCPELSSTYAENPHPTIEDVKSIIIEKGCGLRPAREGGIRLETDVLETAKGLKVPVVHNYGHGGSGYQSSWGSARIATELLEGILLKAA